MENSEPTIDPVEYLKELTDQYPTVESAVEHYRHGVMSDAMFCVRFPDLKDQEAVQRLAALRNTEDGVSQN